MESNVDVKPSDQAINTPSTQTEQVDQKPISPVKIKVSQRKSQVEGFPIIECPTFRPTIEEFTSKSFSDLLIEYENQCGDSGIFKVSVELLNQHSGNCTEGVGP